MAKKTIKKTTENKVILDIAIQGAIQALVICILVYLMFGEGNATIVAILDAIRQSKVDVWQVSVIAFPIVFTACTAVQLAGYILRTNKK